MPGARNASLYNRWIRTVGASALGCLLARGPCASCAQSVSCSWFLKTCQTCSVVNVFRSPLPPPASVMVVRSVGVWAALLLWLWAGAADTTPAVDDECGQQACTLQMLQHVAERRARRASPMHPDMSVLRWDQTPTPGGLVSGSLSVFLDPADETSPRLELEVAMYFARQQPAPLGPLLLHCGGPGSGSSCVSYVPGSVQNIHASSW